jgi:hypothetical protein
MAKRGSITINGGIFLTKKDKDKQSLKYDYWDVGYFECEAGFPDIRFYIDGNEPQPAPLLKLGLKGGMIEIKLDRQGIGMEKGVKIGNTFYTDLLRREKLYQERVPLHEDKLDAVLRFHSGFFRPSMVKRRYFKQHDPTGTLNNPTRQDMGAIAHNIIVDYDLQDGDKLTIGNGANTYFERVVDASIQNRLEVEILADDPTSLKYFCNCVEPGKAFYWVPNQGMPPPSIMP